MTNGLTITAEDGPLTRMAKAAVLINQEMQRRAKEGDDTWTKIPGLVEEVAKRAGQRSAEAIFSAPKIQGPA